ncbi:MAG: pyridoxal phosphate-dependent aminotransferase [Planctomycetota bacterium]
MLSQRVRELEAAATLEMNARRIELAEQGRSIVNFGVGEPDFPTPEFVCEAAKRAIDDGWTRYTAVAGVPELRSAVAEVTSKSRQIEVAPEEVIITCGAKHALAEVLLAQVDRGDEVLIPGPYWVSYPEMVRVCEGIPVPVMADASSGYKVTPEQLEAAVSPRTVGMFLNTPNNPTGVIYSREEIDALVAFAKENDIWILSDEIYEEFAFEGEFASAISGEGRDTTVLVSGVSKSFAMTGWRIGWAVADRAFVARLTRLQSHTASNPTAVSQAATIAALMLDDDGFRSEMLTEFRKRRDTAVDALGKIEGLTFQPPAGAFYVLCDIHSILERPGAPKTSRDFCLAALDEASVALVPGEAFGVPGAVRISYACGLESVEKGLASLHAYIDRIGS